VELPQIGGGRLRLHDLRGRVLAISFYSSYCPPCRKELPTLLRLLDRVNRDLPPEKRVVALVVAIDAPPDARLLRELGPRLRWLLDGEGKARTAFDPRTYPCTFLIDSHGTVRHINRGYGSGYEARVEGWLRGLLPGRRELSR
jgi:thiol-disulfide isomerase/thioredoxin